MEQKRDASRFYPGVIGIPYVVSIRIQFSDLVRMVLPENEWQEPKSVPVVAGVDYGKSSISHMSLSLTRRKSFASQSNLTGSQLWTNS
jgi:hypothetical protein